MSYERTVLVLAMTLTCKYGRLFRVNKKVPVSMMLNSAAPVAQFRQVGLAKTSPSIGNFGCLSTLNKPQ